MFDKIKLWYYKYVLSLDDKQLNQLSEKQANYKWEKSTRCRKCDRLGDIIEGSSNIRYCPHCNKTWKVKEL